MSQRKKRLAKLIEHRQHALDAKLGALAVLRVAEQTAITRADDEREVRDRAARERNDAVSRPVAVGHFVDASVFLQSCAKRSELAELELARARRAVQKAQVEVVLAKNDLKKIQLLTERLDKEEQIQAARVEQRLSDEFSARKSADAHKGRS